ncbi:uncharacterized protein LOC132743095 [Ruditapes philippinarum]|uniref:uncharacterized protein LOC132743095 n=1 Tax=Ruditapes philippinarum TaxID=129788 RepID=UPI00295C199C|nr:uncharacterized protein LOC132743095 [Ruditapes philippinarum]
MNRSRSFPGQPVSITTAVQRFNRRKYGQDDVTNSAKHGTQTYASGGNELSPVVSESTRRRQKFSKQIQNRNRKYKETKMADSLSGADIPKITRELTFFLPNSWEFDKPAKDQEDTLQKPAPIANCTVHVTEIDINISKKS